MFFAPFSSSSSFQLGQWCISYHNHKNADEMMGRHLGRFVKNVKSSFAFDGVRERLSHFLDPYHGFGNKCIQVHHHHRHPGNGISDIIDDSIS